MKRQHVPHVGTPPAIDRLIVVAHHTEIAVPLGELLHQEVLGRIRVLEFVDQHVLKSILPVRQALGMLAEQRKGVHQQIIEVHRIGLLQGRDERRIDVRRDSHERRVGLGPQLLRQDHAILGARDDRLHRAGRIGLGRQLLRLEEAFDERLGVVGVVDREVGPEA